MHPQAKFDPIPPDFDLHALVDETPNFDWVVRISISQIRRLGTTGFEKLVQLHVIEGGRPLVIEGWNKVLPESIFSANWLESVYDKKRTVLLPFFTTAGDMLTWVYRGECSRPHESIRYSHDDGSLPAIYATAHQSVESEQLSR